MVFLRGSNIFKRYAVQVIDVDWDDLKCGVQPQMYTLKFHFFFQTANMYFFISVFNQILCIKLVKYWDKFTEMHGQQNVKICKYVRHLANYI